jgi:hypothetical protein
MRGYYYAITFGLIVAGILSIANLIVAKKPELEEHIEKLAAYQGYIGASMLLIGIWGFVDGLILSKFYTSNIGAFFKVAKVQTIAILAFPPLCVILGLLQGLPQIGKWTGQDLTKVEAVAKKLAPYSVPFGIASIAVGFLLLLFLLRITF